MQSFQAICAKNNQKVELIVQYNSLEEARKALHNQGYSIVEIKQVEENKNQGKVFYFEIIQDGNKKSGQIQSSDIFKAYIKLVNLHYQVVSIYEDINSTEEEKLFTTSKIHSSYLLFLEQNKNKEIKKEEKIEQTTQMQAAYSDISDTFVGKEIQKYYLLIDKIIQKLETIINTYGQYLIPERKIKLQNFIIAFKQLKNTTNIDKLRIISENALIKIGEIELELIQSNKEIEKQDFLNETNELLKKFGSGTKIRNPDTDIVLKFQRIIKDIYTNFFVTKTEIKEEKKIDTNSFTFYKNLRELNLYKEKLTLVKKDLFIATILFQKEKATRLSIRKKLIIQNIKLIEKRIKNIKFSYSSIVKWLGYYRDIIIFSFKEIGEYLMYSIFIYSIFFIYFFIYWKQSFNYLIIFFLVILLFFTFLTRIIKNTSFFIGYMGIFIFFYIFLQLNF